MHKHIARLKARVEDAEFERDLYKAINAQRAAGVPEAKLATALQLLLGDGDTEVAQAIDKALGNPMTAAHGSGVNILPNLLGDREARLTKSSAPRTKLNMDSGAPSTIFTKGGKA